MKYFIFILTLLFFTTTSAVAVGVNTGNKPTMGTNFSCNVNTNKCSCSGKWDGADCKAMRIKKCVGGSSTVGRCSTSGGFGQTCKCTMKTSSKTTSGKRNPRLKPKAGNVAAPTNDVKRRDRRYAPIR